MSHLRELEGKGNLFFDQTVGKMTQDDSWLLTKHFVNFTINSLNKRPSINFTTGCHHIQVDLTKVTATMCDCVTLWEMLQVKKQIFNTGMIVKIKSSSKQFPIL